MFELPEAWLPIVQALTDAPIAWQTPAELASALGWDPEEATDMLSLLDVAGWVAVWDRDPAPCVTLSAIAAERLNVHLVEVGPGEVPRWARAGDPPPPRPKAKHVCAAEGSASLAFVADPRPSPDLAAERAEEADAIAAALPEGPARGITIDDLPRPTLLIGQGLSPWPGPARDRRDPCPACRGRRLEPHAYCLRCDRWGMDWKIQDDPASRPPSRSRPVPPSPEEQARRDRLQADRDRARRKARRRARNRARAGPHKN